MVRDNVTFRFRVDSARAEETFRRLEAMARKFGGTVERTSGKVNNLKTNMGKLDQQSAASAINFQTATQGALNLSTAMVQTYTSISNLDRANNRAKQSVIAVSRAEDLLNNKIQRRNEMQEAGITGGMKYANISREIATAEADLTVKIEKRGIEQAAVNDIYMLFATNIANVTISSMQTIAVLDKNQILLTKGKTIALKVQNMAIWSNIRATGASIKSISLLSITSKIGIGVNLSLAGSIKAVTLAMKGFMAAHPVLLGFLVATTLAVAAYETNFRGLKDAIDKLLPSQVSFQDQVEGARNALGEQNSQLEQFNDLTVTTKGNLQKINPLFKDYMNILENTNTALDVRLRVQAELLRQGGTVGGISQGGVNASVTGGTQTGVQGTQIGLPANVPGFMLPLVAKAQKIKSQKIIDSYPIIPANVELRQDGTPIVKPDGIFLYKLNTSSFESQLPDPVTDFTPFMTKLEKAQISLTSMDPLAFGGGGFQVFRSTFTDIGTQFETLTADKFSVGFSVLSDQTKLNILNQMVLDQPLLDPKDKFTSQQKIIINNEMNRITGKDHSKIIIDPVQAFKEIVSKPPQTLSEFEENFLEKFSPGSTVHTGVRINLPPILEHLRDKFPIDKGNKFLAQRDLLRRKQIESFFEPLQGTFIERQMGRKKDAFGRDVTGNIFFAGQGGRELAERQSTFLPSFLRGGGITNFGMESGFINDLLEDQAQTIRDTGGFQKTRNNLGIQNKIQFDAMNREANISDMSRFRGQIRRSQRLEILKRNAKTLADNRRRLNIRDANTNLLRFGGRLREGMTIEDEGAVIGGYSSVREFSAAARAQREIAWTQGKTLAASFGQVMPSGYLSGQGWKSESSRLASRATEMKNALASAGLGFKNVGYLDYAYRASSQQVARATAEHSAAVAYNQNQYAKATQINLLEGGFDLSGFRGTSMDLPSLQNKIQEQDDLMKSIGLTRTEAFQIIDTQGRGREEIDDRLKWKSRLNRMSSGVAVL